MLLSCLALGTNAACSWKNLSKQCRCWGTLHTMLHRERLLQGCEHSDSQTRLGYTPPHLSLGIKHIVSYFRLQFTVCCRAAFQNQYSYCRSSSILQCELSVRMHTTLTLMFYFGVKLRNQHAFQCSKLHGGVTLNWKINLGFMVHIVASNYTSMCIVCVAISLSIQHIIYWNEREQILKHIAL